MLPHGGRHILVKLVIEVDPGFLGGILEFVQAQEGAVAGHHSDVAGGPQRRLLEMEFRAQVGPGPLGLKRIGLGSPFFLGGLVDEGPVGDFVRGDAVFQTEEEVFLVGHRLGAGSMLQGEAVGRPLR